MFGSLNEFTNSNILIRDSAVPSLEILLSKFIEGKPLESLFPVNKLIQNYLPNLYENDPFSDFEEDSIAIIPIAGTMRKNGYPWSPGMDEIADLIRKADAAPNILGTILLINTPGGSTFSVFQMEDALKNRIKPAIALVDGMCCSGGIYVASFCNEIYSLNKMCEIGSIGTYAMLMDDAEFYKKYGIKIIYVYPPESKFKNLSVRETLEGNPERLIKEELTPFAIHFQNIIKQNRPKLDLSVEGIVEGLVFYAYDAVTYNLIDGITNMQGAVNRVIELSNINKSIFSI